MKKETSQFILSHTLMEMMAEQDISQISINDILQESNISKATFYKYFNNKSDLLCYTVYNDLIAGTFYDFSRSPKDRKQETMEFIQRNRLFYRNALVNPSVCEMYRDHCESALYGYYARCEKMDLAKLRQTCTFLTSGIIQFNQNFALGKISDSPQTIALWYAELLEVSTTLCWKKS